jgi:hypothetical protein
MITMELDAPVRAAESLGELAEAYLGGLSRALELLEAIRQDTAHPDALARAVEALAAEPEALQGLCRTVQKRLECGLALREGR